MSPRSFTLPNARGAAGELSMMFEGSSMTFGDRALPPGLLGLLRGVSRWRDRHRDRRTALTLRQLPLTACLTDTLVGTRVRLEGHVVPGPTLTAPLSGLPVLAERHRIEDEGGNVVEDRLSANRFLLALADGTRVQIAADEAAWADALVVCDQAEDRWRDRWRGRGHSSPSGVLYRESRVVPGQLIQASGLLGRALDPRQPVAGFRPAAITWTLSSGGAPLALGLSTRSAASPAAAQSPTREPRTIMPAVPVEVGAWARSPLASPSTRSSAPQTPG